MLNFLSEQAKKGVKKEYYARVFLLFLYTICLLAVYSISAIFPTYTFSLNERSRLAQEVQINNLETSKCSEDETNCSDPLMQIKSTNSFLDVLKDDNRTFVSVPLMEVLSKKNNGIKITSIKYLGETSGQYSFSINGLSKSREELLAFSSNLKKDVRFTKISLPISDFVKSVDINFVLTINVKK